ncbi:ThiF family adenylyltransferase [Actinomycetospora sp. C-140]
MLPAPATAPPSPVAALLPDRPRLRLPPLHRAAGALQFGADPARALVVDGLTPPLARMVEALDGSRPMARVLADAAAAGASPGVARGVLERLHAAGLLAAGDEPGALDGRRVVVRGAGRVAVAVACLLATAGVGRVLVEAEGTVCRADLGTGLVADDVGRPARLAIPDAVARVAPGSRAPGAPSARRWLTARADLVVLADADRPDPVAATRLVLAGRAHLPVALAAGVGTVGPLVVPGRTPCLHCEDLVRTAEDPAWPRLAAELAGRRSPAPVALAAATAALAVAEVLAVLDPAGVAAAWGATLTLAAHGARDRTPARRHPDCGCDVHLGPSERPGPARLGPAPAGPQVTPSAGAA